MSRFTDRGLASEIRQCSSGDDKEKLLTEVGARGEGRLACRIRAGKAEFFYQYTYQGKRERIALGQYRGTGRSGISLSEARDKVAEYARLKKDHPDLKAWFLEQERLRKAELEELAKRGSFNDLLDAYLEKLQREGKASHSVVSRSFNCYVKKAWPSLVERKAKDIEPAHISAILAKMIDQGITTTTNRLRSQLHAAFSVGLMSEYDPRKRLGKHLSFGLTHNPVSAIPVQTDWERIGDRYLSEDEIRIFWHSLPGKMAPHTALFFKFLLATGGQRPKQVLAASWADYDKKRLFFEQINDKDKGKQHLTPFNSIAWDLVKSLSSITGGCCYPFAGLNLNPNKPLTLVGVGSALRRHIKEKDLPAFVMRDLRRTAKTHMKKAGLGSEITERIQARVFGDIGSRHYDKHDYLEEKREALEQWGEYLQKILEGKAAKKPECL